jgi:hypothetical protein
METPDGSSMGTEGETFTLEVQVPEANFIHLLGGTISYSWTRQEGTTRSSVLGTSTVYTFTPQAGDHGAAYHCRASVNSAALNLPVITGGFTIIDVLGKKRHGYLGPMSYIINLTPISVFANP